MIKFSGFADEAGKDIEAQIRATKELGWDSIELRFINGVNATDVEEDVFLDAAKKLIENGIKVSCFGSAVANGKDPLNPADVEYCFAALERAVPRMKMLGAKYIRGMACVYHTELSRAENEKLIFPFMKKIVDFCEKNDIIYLCENCGGYAVSSYDCMLKLKKEMNSPNFAFVYDTGNVVGAKTIYDDGSTELQNPWTYYTYIKDHIDYVHVKDQIAGDGPKPTRTYPGEGEGDVIRILADIINSGYDGIIAIEPHLGNGYEGYIEYGRRTMKIIEEVKEL